MSKVVPQVANLSTVELAQARVGFGEGLLTAGQANSQVMALCADLTDSIKIGAFAKALPKQYIEVGVAEQNMMGIAAGLALSGKVPFVASYAVFNPGRNWDQLRVSVCYSEANVKVVGAHAGISVGPDGATHQALEDVAITRVLPNLTVVVPTDIHEARKATIALAEHVGPCYIRFGRENIATITTEETPFILGKANLFREGKDVTICANGALVYEALLAEEAQVNGGLGSAVAELVGETCAAPLRRIGVLDTFGESGKPNELMDAYGLRASNIVAAVKEVIKRKV
jgi:transketolase